jgi:hypothetical protein
MGGNDAGWFTMQNVHDYRDDINARTDPGDVVYATGPTFVADSHVRLVNDNPRIHMVLVRYRNSGPGEPLYASIIDHLESGRATHVILSRTSRRTFAWNATAYRVFRDNYCRVEAADDLYQRANAYLYEYRSGECPEHLRPTLNQTLVPEENAVI